MSDDRAHGELPRGRRRLRRARRRQAPGDRQGAVDLARCSPRAAGARSTPRAASRRSCSSSTGARSRSSSRGWARSRSSPARCSSARGSTASPTSPTTRSRRSSTTSAASGALPLVVNAYFATGASDWYRDAERVGGAARGLAPAPAPTPAARGEEASRRRCRASSTSATSSWPAPPSASCRRARAPILGERAARRATRSCSSPPAGCTPTAPRWRGCSPDACPTATRRALASGTTLGEALLAPSVMYAPLVAAVLEARPGAHLHQPRDRSRPAQADAPAKAADLSHRAPAAGARGARASSSSAPGSTPHAAYSTFNMGSGYALYCAAGDGRGDRRARAASSGFAALRRRARRGGPAAGRARAGRRALRGRRARAVGRLTLTLECEPQCSVLTAGGSIGPVGVDGDARCG